MDGRVYSVLSVKAYDEEEDRVIEGIASTPTPDRMGDVVEPSGVKYTLPIPLLWQHRHDAPVGSVEAVEVGKDGVKFRARIAKILEPGTLKDRVDEAWQSLKAGLIRGVSIGFRGLDGDFLPDGSGIHFKEWEWFELSLVTVPAQAEATIDTIKSFDQQALAASGKGALPDRKERAAFGRKVKAKQKEIPMAKKSYAEQIEEFRNARQEKSDQMKALIEDSEGETLDAAQSEEFEELEADIKAIDDQIKRLKTLDSLSKEEAKPVTQDKTAEAGTATRSGRVSAVVKAPAPEPGIRFARFARVIALSGKTYRPASEVAEQLFADRDPDLVKAVNAMQQKAAVPSHTSTSLDALIGNEGGFADFVEFLRPMTILGRFGNGGIPGLRRVPFRVPLINQATGANGYWVGEGKAKPLTSVTAGRQELIPNKVANIAVATMELLRDSSPSAEAMLRDDMAASLSETMDLAFIDPANAGVANVRPASITNGATANASAGADADSARADLATAMGAFVAANNALNTGVWIMSGANALALSLQRNALGQREFPDMTLSGGTWEGLPVIVSNYVADTITLVKASDIWFADEGGVDVAMSTEATLEMEDAPTMDSDTPAAATGAMVSMFQTNSVALRAERTLNWARRRPEAVSIITGAAYAA